MWNMEKKLKFTPFHTPHNCYFVFFPVFSICVFCFHCVNDGIYYRFCDPLSPLTCKRKFPRC